MIRTNIYLTQHQHQYVKNAARNAGMSISEYVRVVLDGARHGFSVTAKATQPHTNTGELLKQIAERVAKIDASGPRDLSSRVDHYLYGEDIR